MRSEKDVELEHPSRNLVRYRVGHVKLAVATRLEVALLRVVGPAVAQGFSNIDLRGGEEATLQSVFIAGGGALMRFAQTMSLEDLDVFEREMFAHVAVWIDGDPNPTALAGFRDKELYETLFGGDGRAHYYALIGACLEHNFSSFLGPGQRFLSLLDQAGASLSRSPKASAKAGTSGESAPPADST